MRDVAQASARRSRSAAQTHEKCCHVSDTAQSALWCKIDTATKKSMEMKSRVSGRRWSSGGVVLTIKMEYEIPHPCVENGDYLRSLGMNGPQQFVRNTLFFWIPRRTERVLSAQRYIRRLLESGTWRPWFGSVP